MPVPRFCTNGACPNSERTRGRWLVRNGHYRSEAHGTVQRYRCRICGSGVSDQTESVHYYAKRRLDLKQIYSRLRGGSSQRDIARELGTSRTAISSAALRLGRQAMAAHVNLMCGLQGSGRLSFDGLMSRLTSGDYPAHITALADTESELILAMTHCVTERGGRRTEIQRSRIEAKRKVWRPSGGALKRSICLLVSELAGLSGPKPLLIATDCHPLYPVAIETEPRLRWHRVNGLLEHQRTSGSAPRTTANPLFVVNYIDRMMRHRIKEHTRETIAFGRESTSQMHRMWIFVHDHNTRQPKRVAAADHRSRALAAGISARAIDRVQRRFFSRRLAVRGLPVPRSIRQVWRANLDTPPVRWRVGQIRFGPVIPNYALRDLSACHPHAP